LGPSACSRHCSKTAKSVVSSTLAEPSFSQQLRTGARPRRSLAKGERTARGRCAPSRRPAV
jgi:hypothetical protein